MLRIVHTADVHLGARHDDLGEQASAQRERQFAAFKATVDLALAAKVDLVLIAGDLFDSNVQPRRSVERVAAELGRLVAARIRTAIIPGTHDVYDRASIYRAYDLKTLAGSAPGDDLVTVLTPERPMVHLAAIKTTVHGRVFATKRAPESPLKGLDVAADPPDTTWHIGMVHGSIAIPGKTDRDEVVITTEEIAASGLDYLALGHWHSVQEGKAGGVTYAYSGGARGRRRRPGSRRQGAPRHPRRDPGRTHRPDRPGAGRQDALRTGPGRRRDDPQPARPRSPASPSAATPTSSSTPGSSASAPTSSISTRTKSRARSRPRS